MKKRYIPFLGLSLVSLLLLTAADDEKRGCGSGLNNRPGEKGVDVGGVDGADWAVSYGSDVEVTIKDGGAVVATQTLAWAVGGSFDVEETDFDLQEFCDREDVVCPYDVFPDQVTMTQPGNDLHLLFVTFEPKGPLADAVDVTLLGNVDSDYDFSIALGVQGATNGVCGLLGVSYATGSITTNSADPPKGVSLEGEIVVGYAGGCLVAGTGGALGAGITVELRLPFTATRL